MHDSMPMQVFHRAQHLAHDIGSLSLRKSLGCNDAIEKFTATAVFHHDVDVSMVDIALIELHNIGVIDCLKDS